MHRPFAILILCVFAFLLPGCERESWEVVVQNQGDEPCSISIDLNDGGYIRIHNLPKGEPKTLDVGRKSWLVVRSVKVTRGREEQELKLDTRLAPGKKFFVSVAPDGKVTTSISSR